jgi:hypothetical protein
MTGTMESIFQPTEEYIKSNELIKQSTALKKTDINKAIEFIKEAISIYPSDDSSFKLANYYFDSGNIQDSYAVLNGLLDKYSYPGFEDMKNMNRYKVFEKMAVINFKDKKYSDYVKSSSLQFFNWLIGLSVQGRRQEITGLITRQPFEMYFVETKMNKSFKELNLVDKQKDFYSALQNHFAKSMDKLILLCDIFEKSDLRSFKDMQIGDSVGSYTDRKLSKNQTFIDTYKTLDEKLVGQFVDAQLNAH